jgi:hypothetical protein
VINLDVEIHGAERLNQTKEIFPKMPLSKVNSDCFFCHKEDAFNDIDKRENIIQMIMMRDGVCGECAERMLYGTNRHAVEEVHARREVRGNSP